MPWTQSDAHRHNRAVNSTKKAEVWAKVANETRARTKSDSQAIREANAVVDRMGKGKKNGR